MGKKYSWIVGLLVLTLCAGPAMAQVAPDEAAKLKTTLTPFGSERAGNADGTIPAWTGGLTKAPASWKAPNGFRPDPFSDEKPLFTITAQNMDQYADKLTEGQKALLKRYPNSYKMNVYPTHRTHALPDYVVENTYKNATSAKLVDGGSGLANALPGVPFPLPENGLEAIWNHLTRFQGEYKSYRSHEATIQTNGSYSLETTGETDITYPQYVEAKAGSFDPKSSDNVFLKYNLNTLSPASEAGYGILVLDTLNPGKEPRKAWIYSPGERRVRRAPTLNFDTPDRSTTVYDDYELFVGSPERYDWKLVEKKEIYIPYNSYRMHQPDLKFKDILKPYHHDSELVRWELHRVWVVEATVKKGARHVYAKRTFYLDEDSWNAVATDKFDGRGELWRTGFAFLMSFYDVPMTSFNSYTHLDLKNGIYYDVGLSNEYPYAHNFTKAAPRDSFYTPAALRRRGRR